MALLSLRMIVLVDINITYTSYSIEGPSQENHSFTWDARSGLAGDSKVGCD